MELFIQLEVKDKSFILLHSALDRFSPNKALDSYELPDFLFGRPNLNTAYYSDKTLIFGHTPTRILSGKDEILQQQTWIDIDCGCVFKGGRLGCLCLDTMKEFYV